MKEKMNESDCPWESPKVEVDSNNNNNNSFVELFEELNEPCPIAESSDKANRNDNSPQATPSRLAFDPSKHRSKRCERFLEHCTKPEIRSPLSAKFHFCSEEELGSKRKRNRSLRTRNSSSSSSCSSSTSSSPVPSDSFSRDSGNESGNAVFGEKVEHAPSCHKTVEISKASENLRHEHSRTHAKTVDNNAAHTPANSSEFSSDSGTHARVSLDEEEEDDTDDRTRSVERDAIEGMTAKTNADLLEVQRRRSTDVTPMLKNRWIQSHFPEPLPGDAKGKRRKLKKRDGACKGHDEPTQISHLLQDDDTCWQGDSIESTLNILHFNDVYEIAERKGDERGGAARFAWLFNKMVAKAEAKYGERPLVVFSGDCLNPSTLSCATQGTHMIEILNHLQVDVAVFGNHEFDFGVAHAVKCVKEMTSVWLLANVEDRLTERNLAEGVSSVIVERKSGQKVGLIGLVEKEWLDTLAAVEKSDLIFTDYVEVAKRVAKELKEKGADFIIAATHMRWPNDIKLAREVPDVDLILGGHDHGYGVKDIDECLIVKSGSDFRNFTSIDVTTRKSGCIDVKLTRHDITSTSCERDPEMREIVDRYVTTLEKSLEKCIGTIKADLNGNFDSIRCEETTLGNFVADIMATVTDADLVLINSGTFRSGAVHRSGDFCLHDLMSILPITDTLVSIVVTGQQLLDALENGVGQYPRLDGRFPQISGACFGFDPKAEPGERVVPSTVRVRGKRLDLNATYKLVTKAYVARGRDGYTCLKDCEILTDPDSGPLLSTVVRNHILNVKRLIDFEESQSCKISISNDGKQLTCSDPSVDISNAFDCDVEELESPFATVQRSMRSVISSKHSFTSEQSLTGEVADDASKTVRIPHFIAATENTKTDCGDRRLSLLRAKSRNADESNAKLIEERRQSPNELRWQVTPLVEARIFHCSTGTEV